MPKVNIKKEQLDFLDWELGVFFHFGIRTFYEGHVDWDMKEMPLSGFNPSGVDCDNWIKTVKEAGATVGHKRICAFPTMDAKKIEVVLDKSKKVDIKAYYVPAFN